MWQHCEGWRRFPDGLHTWRLEIEGGDGIAYAACIAWHSTAHHTQHFWFPKSAELTVVVDVQHMPALHRVGSLVANPRSRWLQTKPTAGGTGACPATMNACCHDWMPIDRPGPGDRGGHCKTTPTTEATLFGQAHTPSHAYLACPLACWPIACCCCCCW